MSGATGVIAGAAVAGAGASIYGATRKVDTPDPRNLAQEARDTLATQIALAPEQYANYAKYAPQYAATDLGILQQSLFGSRPTLNTSTAQQFLASNPQLTQEITAQPGWAQDGRTPAQWLVDHIQQTEASEGGGRFTDLFNNYASQQPLSENSLLSINSKLTDYANQQTIDSNRSLREADLRDVADLGSQVQAAQRGANPELFGNLDRLDAAAQSPIGAGQYEQAAGRLALAGAPTLSLGRFDPSGSLATTNFGFSPVSDQFSYSQVQGPGRDPLLGSLNARSMTFGPGSLQTTLEQQAADELARGGALSPEEQRTARVTARSAADSRGLGLSNAGIAAEVLNLDSAQRARLNDARSFAAAVDAQGFGQRNQALQTGLGVVGANQQRQGLLQQAQTANQAAGLQAQDMRRLAQTSNQGAGLQTNALNLQGQLANQNFLLGSFNANNTAAQNEALFNLGAQSQQFSQLGALNSMEAARRGEDYSRLLSSTQARLGTYTDPFQGVLGRSSSNVGTNTNLFGSAQSAVQPGMTTSRSQFDPYNSYASDLYNTNYNAQAAANISAANNRSALLGAGLGALGTLGGAAIAACWVAREVYGPRNPQWRQFRRWLLDRAPLDFVAHYLATGRRAAARIRHQPATKARLREWMDARIAESETLNLQPA